MEISKTVDKLKDLSKAKFDETIEIAISLNLPKSLPSVRGYVDLPHKHMRNQALLVISDTEVQGLGPEDILTSVEDIPKLGRKLSKVDFAITLASDIPKIGKAAKILGPKGLMPSPKMGTVGNNIAALISAFKATRVTFQSDKTGIVHCGVGKVSMASDSIVENINAIVEAISNLKPEKATNFVGSMFISSTMGKSFQI